MTDSRRRLIERVRALSIPDGLATNKTVNGFLAALDEAVEEAGLGHRVFRKEVCVRDAVDRQNLDHYRDTGPDDAIDKPGDTAAVRAGKEKLHRERWGYANEAAKVVRTTGKTFFLVASPPASRFDLTREYRDGGWADPARRGAEFDRAKRDYYAGGTAWHTAAIEFTSRSFAGRPTGDDRPAALIYDPSDDGTAGDGRLGSNDLLRNVRYILHAIVQRFKPGKGIAFLAMELGGGGNTTERCRDMSCIWIRARVLRLLGDETAADGVPGRRELRA